MNVSKPGSQGKMAALSIGEVAGHDRAVMLRRRLLGVLGLAAGLLAADARPAEACGAPFFRSTESVSVDGHRMVVALSRERTVVWDRIDIQGNPSEVAWVIPVREGATLETSTEAFFSSLDQSTAPQVEEERRVGSSDSTGGGGCGSAAGDGAAAPSRGADFSQGGGVTVLERTTVGPYDTVKIRTAQPGGANGWLEENGFAIPDEAKPVLESYTREGFDFIAVRVRPGAANAALVPLKLTTPGADPTLPLRMSRVGLRAKADLTLYVIAEGRYRAAGFDEVTVDASKLRFDGRDDQGNEKSNYLDVTNAQLDAANGGRAFVVELAAPDTTADRSYPSIVKAEMDRVRSNGAPVWITRLRGRLPATAFDRDIRFEASPAQEVVSNRHVVRNGASGATVAAVGPSRGLGSLTLVAMTAFALTIVLRRRRG